jgi:hypothetical protein
MMPGLQAPARRRRCPGTSVTIEMSAVRMMSTSSWPDANRFDHDDVDAGRVEDQAPHRRSSERGRPDGPRVAMLRMKTAVVLRVRLHPQPVAEHRAAR